MTIYRQCLILLLCLTSVMLNAQFQEGTSIDANFHYGRILKHTPKFKPTISEPTWGLEINLHQQSTGKKIWSEMSNYPAWGLTFYYMKFGNDQTFGNGYSLIPHFTFVLARHSFFKLQFRGGLGLGVVTKTFDLERNPLNNVIGSKLNMAVAFQLNAALKIHKNWSLLIGGDLNHYSNAAIQSPNLGINLGTTKIGLRYHPKEVARIDFRKNDLSLWPFKNKRWHYQLQLGASLREVGGPGGPKYPIYLVNADVGYTFTKIIRGGLGLSYEYNSEVSRFVDYIDLFKDKQVNYQQGHRLLIYAYGEWLFGRLGVYGQLGTYLSDSYLQRYWLFTRIGAKYYLMHPVRSKFQVTIGWQLKAHLITAEYGAVVLGFNF